MLVSLFRRFLTGAAAALLFFCIQNLSHPKRRQILFLLLSGASYCAVVTLLVHWLPEVPSSILYVMLLALGDFARFRFRSTARASCLVFSYLQVLTYSMFIFTAEILLMALSGHGGAPQWAEAVSLPLFPLVCAWRFRRPAHFQLYHTLLFMPEFSRSNLFMLAELAVFFILLAMPPPDTVWGAAIWNLAGPMLVLAAFRSQASAAVLWTQERRNIIADDHQRRHDKEDIQRYRENRKRRLSAARQDWELAPELAALDGRQILEHIDGQQLFLPPTGLPSLDSYLKIFHRNCADAGVVFTMFAGEPPCRLLHAQGITAEVLRRILATLLDNAFQAVQSAPGSNAGTILLMMGRIDGVYRIEVVDSGPPFALDVLQNLGLWGNTTGGSGVGLPALLDAIRPCRASFLLEDQLHVNGPLKKSISVSFDGRARRNVYTRREALLRLRRNTHGFTFIGPERKDV